MDYKKIKISFRIFWTEYENTAYQKWIKCDA
jgi:hypothetical protein